VIPATMGSPPGKENGAWQGAVGGQSVQAKTAVAELCYPSPQTVKGRVLGALLNGQSLTHLDCWRRFGSARLSHHSYILRGSGWPVQMIEETVTTSDAGRPATIGVYFLTPESIADAGQRGQKYAAECARIEAERRAA
jgi:hypothetical protein